MKPPAQLAHAGSKPTTFIYFIAMLSAFGIVRTETRGDTTYVLVTVAQDAGGCRIASANYSADSSIGTIGGLSTAVSPPETIKSGYVGQLYDPAGLSIGASPTNVNEGAGRQLAAAQIMDDSTLLTLAPVSVSWSVLSGPINSISSAGLATAGNVYQDTPASVGGSAGGFSASLGLLVANVTSDDFGLYAGDGIDDDWQVFYFGEENPYAAPDRDPDHDGQPNLFESLALVVPIDHSSIFELRARPTPSQPGKVDVVFSPIRTERTYTVQYSSDLIPSGWQTLTGGTQNDNGEERTVTDPIAGSGRKFYRVQIGR